MALDGDVDQAAAAVQETTLDDAQKTEQVTQEEEKNEGEATRELSQTDHLNKKLLQSLLSNTNANRARKTTA